MWVLMLYMLISKQQVAMMTAEFSSQKACETAATEFIKTKPFEADMDFVCVKK